MRVKDEEQIASRRALIMRAAREIMETQGMEALSIRKIAAMIQQTPGIIYHYFSREGGADACGRTGGISTYPVHHTADHGI
ncbi:MAG: helix-turn-helix domain-containing protein [Streptococcus sp.]